MDFSSYGDKYGIAFPLLYWTSILAMNISIVSPGTHQSTYRFNKTTSPILFPIMVGTNFVTKGGIHDSLVNEGGGRMHHVFLSRQPVSHSFPLFMDRRYFIKFSLFFSKTCPPFLHHKLHACAIMQDGDKIQSSS
ncbi:hypothetical protein DM02DRAFT_126954 [Periconia macrospinosa]|uniref:Uncharacterized protein n=1 Tax=Periconia macrospinosa TaxID=97972 RepID=A0A2V1E3I0_9PLEO|nr:hypothetical protein DM02DRAFT_126954 [Periconia macrospinosa]